MRKLPLFGRLAVLFISLALSPSLASAGAGDYLGKKIARMRLGGTARLNQELTRGLGLAAAYRIESNPSYREGYYTRLDQYQLTANVRPGELLLEAGTPFGLGLHSHSDVTFARQFESREASLTALPYTLEHLPVTARIAEEKLSAGDYVSFASRLSVTGSVGILAPLVGPLSATASAQLVATGDFLVQVYRLKESRVRVRLLGLTERSAGLLAGIQAGVPLRVFSVDLSRHISLRPVSFEARTGSEHTLGVDFVYDLARPEAREAYDRLLSPRAQFAAVEAARFLGSPAGGNTVFLADLAASERLAARDRHASPAARAVDRVFLAEESARFRSFGITLDLKLTSVSETSTRKEERLTVTDRAGQARRYVFDSATEQRKAELAFGLLTFDETFSAGLLAGADASFRATTAPFLVLRRSHGIRSFGPRHLEHAVHQVRGLVPVTLGERAERQLRESLELRGDREILSDSRFETELFIGAGAVAAHLGRSEAELRALLERHVRERFTVDLGRGPELRISRAYALLETRINGERPPFCTLLACFGRDFDAVAARLHRALRTDLPAAERVRELAELASFPIWREAGPAFLVSLIPAERAERELFVQVKFKGRGATPFSFELGRSGERAELRDFLEADGMLGNRTLDLGLSQ